MIKKTILIGDPHSNPDTSNNRFSWLGNMILEEEPDLVVCIGDFAEMNSLSSYDKGTKNAEFRRYEDDIDAARDALAKINRPLNEYNSRRKQAKKAPRLAPRKVLTLGNHEDRIDRVVNKSPELYGKVSINDFGFESFGWEVHKYREPVDIEGVCFCHSFPSGVKGEAISGFNIASSIVAKNMVSSVCGHSHLYDHAIRNDPFGRSNIGVCTGWYGETPGYATATNKLWWSGLILLHDMEDGKFDLTQINYNRVKELYG